jgi:molybdopterin-guanine dinucleotide biosynthesis protein MobB
MNDQSIPNAAPVVAVSGVKNSGKTTLLTELIPRLRGHGLRVAVIKHDGHDFLPDVPGTDSYRLRQAGAEAVAVYSAHRYLLTAERPGTTAEELIRRLDNVDLILLEGAKHSAHPKIEIVRGAVSGQSACRPETLLALCTDTGLTLPGVPSLGLEDYEDLTRIILEHLAAVGGSPR